MGAEGPAVIEAEGVRKSFGAYEAVRGVSLSVRPGECFGLLGPNGAGKSTLISLLYGAAGRGAGRLSVFGLDPDRDARAIKRRIGVVTQENALDEGLSVVENMSLYAAFVSVPALARQARVRELLDYMSLSKKEHAPIGSLSGGMKRRLVFVRALLGDPELLILDEPTTGLDPAVRHLLWGKVQELKARGKTILLTTHYMHEAEVLCDRLLIMDEGRVLAEGTPADLRAEHVPGYVAVFDRPQERGALKAAAKSKGYEATQDSSGLYLRAPELSALLELQAAQGATALQLRPSNLEDVFLKLTGRELDADD